MTVSGQSSEFFAEDFSMAKKYFSLSEILLWSLSVILIAVSFFIFDRENYAVLAVSLIGATSLILNAKGNVAGQILTVFFSLIYAVISFKSKYYGEMITYLGMTSPIAILSVITWLKNPFEKGRAEVKINFLSLKEYAFLGILATAVTVIFYFILDFFDTSQIVLSTLSVFTSFIASYLTMRRSEYYAIAYSLNDIILIMLWILAESPSMVICFLVFLINDVYGFLSWAGMKKRQSKKRTL